MDIGADMDWTLWAFFFGFTVGGYLLGYGVCLVHSHAIETRRTGPLFKAYDAGR